MSKPVITVTPDTPIKTAARLLVSCGISAVPVLDHTGALVGIVSEADLLPIETRPDPRAQAAPIRATAGSTPHTVADVMTKKVLTVPLDAEASEAARLMIDARVKRLPVVHDGRVVGIVSRRDLVRVIARADEDLEIELDRRLRELPIGIAEGAVGVEAGIATIQMAPGPDRRLAESIALTVPGVLEVRFGHRTL